MNQEKLKEMVKMMHAYITDIVLLKAVFKDKYTQIAHVDNESVIYSYHSTKDYDMLAIDTQNESWIEGIERIIECNKSDFN